MKQTISNKPGPLIRRYNSVAKAANDASVERHGTKTRLWRWRNAPVNRTMSFVSIYRDEKCLLQAYLADSFFTRVMGLFSYPPLCASQALVLMPCSAVHTVGLRYSIDVAFIDKSGLVLKCVQLKPFSFAHCWHAASVVEMAGGTLNRLNLCAGQSLVFTGRF